jgi:hypothetical protein
VKHAFHFYGINNNPLFNDRLMAGEAQAGPGTARSSGSGTVVLDKSGRIPPCDLAFRRYDIKYSGSLAMISS